MTEGTPQTPPPIPPPPPPAHVPPPTQPGAMPAPGADGMAVASLILGILSCVTCCHPLFSLLFGIVGLILGLYSKSRGGTRKAGITLSIIGPSVMLLVYMLMIAGCVVLPFAASAGR